MNNKNYLIILFSCVAPFLIQATRPESPDTLPSPFAYYKNYHGDQLISPAPQQHSPLLPLPPTSSQVSDLRIEAFTLACTGIEQLENLDLKQYASKETVQPLDKALSNLSHARQFLGFCLPHTYRGHGPVEQPGRGIDYFETGMNQLTTLIEKNSKLSTFFRDNAHAATALKNLKHALQLLFPARYTEPIMGSDEISYTFNSKRLYQLKTATNPHERQLYQEFTELNQAMINAYKKLRAFELDNGLLTSPIIPLNFSFENEDHSMLTPVGI